jgi:polyphenol oxidase
VKWKSLLVVGLALIAPDVWAQGCPPPANTPVGSCAPKTGTPVNFAGDPGAVRVRKSIYKLSAAEITELRLAFQRLRALPSTDPRTWMAQAKVHCWYCAGDNSSAPDVHGTWAFMPWHRDYLYVLEKILGKLVNNPNFALPYWDWNTPDTPTCSGHLRVPPPYLGSANNSLFDCYRVVTPTSTMSVASVGATRVNNILTGANTFSLFFGSANTSAALWPGPHGYVHLFVGNSVNLNVAKQDMGVLETAARDPLFWAHHANIDRLWDSWIAQHGTPVYPAAFLSQNWTFWDQDQRLVRLTAADAANRVTRLKYRYDPPCSPTIAAAPEAAPEAGEEEMIALTPQPQTFRTEAKAARRKYTIGAETGTHVVVNLEEVTAPADQAAILRVYVNKPTATAESAAESTADNRLVEELFIVPSRTPGTGHAGHQHSFNFKIVLPDDIAAEVEAAQGAAPITIVPVTMTAEGPEAAPAAIDVKLKKPYISVE